MCFGLGDQNQSPALLFRLHLNSGCLQCRAHLGRRVLAADVQTAFAAPQSAFDVFNGSSQLLFGWGVERAEVVALRINESARTHGESPSCSKDASEQQAGCQAPAPYDDIDSKKRKRALLGTSLSPLGMPLWDSRYRWLLCHVENASSDSQYVTSQISAGRSRGLITSMRMNPGSPSTRCGRFLNASLTSSVLSLAIVN